MKFKKALLGTAVSTGVLMTPIASADAANPFGLSDLGTGYTVVAEGKCGGKGKCGSKTISVREGKCGEGRCGTRDIREKMDTDNSGVIDRGEFMAWAAKMASEEFDTMDKNHDGGIDISEFLEERQ